MLYLVYLGLVQYFYHHSANENILGVIKNCGLSGPPAFLGHFPVDLYYVLSIPERVSKIFLQGFLQNELTFYDFFGKNILNNSLSPKPKMQFKKKIGEKIQNY